MVSVDNSNYHDGHRIRSILSDCQLRGAKDPGSYAQVACGTCRADYGVHLPLYATVSPGRHFQHRAPRGSKLRLGCSLTIGQQ